MTIEKRKATIVYLFFEEKNEQDSTKCMPALTADSCGVTGAAERTKGKDHCYQPKPVSNVLDANSNLWYEDTLPSETGLGVDQMMSDFLLIFTVALRCGNNTLKTCHFHFSFSLTTAKLSSSSSLWHNVVITNSVNPMKIYEAARIFINALFTWETIVKFSLFLCLFIFAVMGTMFSISRCCRIALVSTTCGTSSSPLSMSWWSSTIATASLRRGPSSWETPSTLPGWANDSLFVRVVF